MVGTTKLPGRDGCTHGDGGKRKTTEDASENENPKEHSKKDFQHT